VWSSAIPPAAHLSIGDIGLYRRVAGRTAAAAGVLDIGAGAAEAADVSAIVGVDKCESVGVFAPAVAEKLRVGIVVCHPKSLPE